MALGAIAYVGNKLAAGQYVELLGLALVIIVVLAMMLALSVVYKTA